MRAIALGLVLSIAAAQASAQAEIGPPARAAAEETAFDRIDDAFGAWVVAPLAAVLFFDLAFWDNGEPHETALPMIVVWLMLGALFFTLRLRFINVRGFGHAIAIAAGRHDEPGDPGELTHFQALSSALSGTIGLGNIAGVALAVAAGGPGAVFWMNVAGVLGMSAKLAECTLGQTYRHVDAEGRVLGGPMRYLHLGLEKRGFGRTGRLLAIVFAVMCMGGSLGGGNMFQANQAFAQTARVIPWLADKSWLFGIVLAALVGLVVLGGIRRIGSVADKVVPLMCVVYMVGGIAVLAVNASHIPEAFGRIFGEAFSPRAGLGGLVGVMMTGFRRAAFSNEAGIGSASIAHSAAATKEPIKEGLVALLEPFIDTVVICTMTGLVVVVTDQYLHVPADADSSARGVLMTSAAFETVLPWFPHVLAVTVFLFAYATMISWCYYGERSWAYLFGARTAIVFRLMFVVAVVLGSILHLGNVLEFSDLMILGMALPNMIGLLVLQGEVATALSAYWHKRRSPK